MKKLSTKRVSSIMAATAIAAGGLYSLNGLNQHNHLLFTKHSNDNVLHKTKTKTKINNSKSTLLEKQKTDKTVFADELSTDTPVDSIIDSAKDLLSSINETTNNLLNTEVVTKQPDNSNFTPSFINSTELIKSNNSLEVGQQVQPLIEKPETKTEEIVQSTVETKTEETVQPAVETKTEETVQPTVETKTEETVQPTVETKTEETVQPTVETRTEEIVQPTVETKTEEIVQPTVETKTEETVQPTVETKTEETVQPTVETVQPTIETKTEEAIQPTVETTNEEVIQPAIETTNDEAIQPTVETTNEEVIQPTVETTANYSPNTYPVGQCTWGVKQLAQWAGNYWGNANQWADSARAAGFSVGSEPVVGSIAVWSGSYSNPYGHVAYVIDVQSSNNIQVLESNYAGNQSIANYRSQFNPNATNDGYVQYIYAK